MKRVILIVLDSVGCGYLPDASKFGDEGADTLGGIIAKRGLNVPNMTALGLTSIEGTSFYNEAKNVIGNFGKCATKTLAKDTTSGHWEMAGFIMKTPFKTYPNGFPTDLIKEFEKRIKRNTIGNVVASGTEIIAGLGDKHISTGFPIVYTSADSVFQIAMHEAIIPLDEQYRFCEIARELLVGDNLVGRVIARPFIGQSGKFERTKNRRDFAVSPMQDTILDALSQNGKQVIGIGKIEDIFCHRGITSAIHTTNNQDGIDVTIDQMKTLREGLIFTNLVDFDMLYGHRNNMEGYAKALEYFDIRLPQILDVLLDEDILIITADHGCDPNFKGTDHTREYVPLLVYGKQFRAGINLGTRDSQSDVGASIYSYFDMGKWCVGDSFIKNITKDLKVDLAY